MPPHHRPSKRRTGGWSGSTAGRPRSSSGGSGARPPSSGSGSGGSGWRSPEWEQRRRADAARYDSGGDSFASLFGDFFSTLSEGGGVSGWVSLLEDLAPSDGVELAEILRSTNVLLLKEELSSARFVQERLRERAMALAVEAKRADAEADSWGARAAVSAEKGGAVNNRMMERELRQEAAARRSSLTNTNKLLARAAEREAKIAARVQELGRGGASGGGGASGAGGGGASGAGGGGGAYRSGGGAGRGAGGASSSTGGGSSGGSARRLGSVDEELAMLKKRMGK